LSQDLYSNQKLNMYIY